MQSALVMTGVAFVAGGIAGGGLEAGGVKVPAIDSVSRQVLLALFGFALIGAAAISNRRAKAVAESLAAAGGPGSTGGSGGGSGSGIAASQRVDLAKLVGAVTVAVPLLAGGAVAGARAIGNVVGPALRSDPPTLSVTPSSGALGTLVTATGSGFGDRESVRIRVHLDEVVEVTTDEDGRFTTQFVMPSDAVCFGRQCNITASGQRTLKSDTRQFERDGSGGISPPDTPISFGPATMTITPTSGTVGTTITVSGSGFGAREPVRIRIHLDEIAEVTTDGTGAFSTKITVPSDATCLQSRCNITASGQNTLKSDTRQFRITG